MSDINDQDAVGRYLANELPGQGDAASFARCDAVMTLTVKLAESAEVGWAFDEAHRLARTGPADQPSRVAPWYFSPWPAWTVAGILAVALVVSVLVPPTVPTTDSDAGTEAAATAASITINQFVISDDIARELAEVEPVVLLANRTPVDSRSLAVLPFTESAPAVGTRSVNAESIYLRVIGQLSAVPGIYLIDPATAAVYSNYDMAAETIAQQLGVRGIVEGRILSVNGSVRFELSFTDAAGIGASLRESIERPTAEVALLEADIASTVIDALTMVPPPDLL